MQQIGVIFIVTVIINFGNIKFFKCSAVASIILARGFSVSVINQIL